ncbi:hypothetical protein FRB91_001275 [Serendipita sp. 411]|nr:hypothetical protein FRB91_001275 [Serendipita sp. 411]
MFRPSFAPPPLRTSGPADESEDEDDAAERRFHHARTLPRTPFPNMANLAIPSDDDDDEDVVVPGQRPRSSSTPGIRPGIMVPPGSSAFGSPDSGMGPIHRERGPHRPAHPAAQPTKSALRSSRRATIDHFGSFGSPPEGLQSPGPNAVFPAGVVPQLRGQQGQMYFQSPPPTAQGVGMMPNGTPFATMPRSRGMPTPMMVPQPNILPASHAHPHGQSRSRIPMQVPQPPIMTPQIMGQHHQPPPNGMPMPMPMPIYQNGMQHQQPPNTPGFPSGAPQTIPIAVTTPGYNYLPTGVPASAAGGHQWQPGHTQGHERDRDRERSAKRHRKHRRNRRRDDESESESESEESERSRSDGGRSSDDDHDGRRRSKRRDRSGTNPLPQPPRILPVPEVHANDAIRVDSPPVPGDDDDRPAPPPKPPPNPLPPPPKHVGSSTDGGGSTLADELAAAAEEVKRAKERTELARAKAIQRLEADTYRAAGVPIGGDEENPVVPLIAGVTVPGILPTGNASAAEEERRKKRRKHSRERSNGKRLTTGAPKEVMVFSNVKTRRRKGGHDEEGESTDEDGDDEEDERRDEGHSHNPIAAGIGSLLKRISTRNNKPQDHHHDQNGNGNGYGYGYQNGGTRRPPPPPPPPKPAPKRGALKRPTMPTHNSYDMPEEEGIVPRNAKRMVMGGNNNQPFRSQTISAANGANMIAGGDAGGGTGQYPFVQPRVPGAQIPMQYDPATQEWFDPSNGMWWNPNTRKYYHKRSTVPTVPASKHKKEGSNGGGLISMLKRWTTNTAPDHQPKPITAQLIMPGGIRRKSFQQQPVAMLANHPHAVAAQQQRGGGPRRRTISAGEMSRMGMGDGEGGNGPWYHPSANANRRMTADQMRDGSGRGRGMLPWGQHQMVDANGFPVQVAQSEMHLPRMMMGGAPPHGMAR